MRAPQECSCSMDLTTSLAEPQEGTRWGEELPWRVLCWCFVRATDRPARVKPYTRSVVTMCSVQKLTRPSLPVTHCAQHSAVPKLRTLLEVDLRVTSKITTKSYLLVLLSPDRSSLHLFMANSQGQSRSKATLCLNPKIDHSLNIG